MELEDITTNLRREFDAEKGSFLLALRCDLRWDRKAFARLVELMRGYIQMTSSSDTLDRWAADGFWYVNDFVRSWSSHPNFPREHGDEYYEQAYQRIWQLAAAYFAGIHDERIKPFEG